ETYHPVLCHLIDVALVARQLWNQVLSEKVKHRVATFFGLEIQACEGWVAFWVGAHDIGKACPGFQFRYNSQKLLEILPPEGYSVSTGSPVPHGEVTVPVLKDWLTKCGVSDKTARRISYAVGGHHGSFARDYHESEHILGNAPWRNAQAEL